MFNRELTQSNAPELPEGLVWLNSDELNLKDLKGKIILLDFWTYSCVNCIRTLPYLKKWHRLYGDLGLVIIGVHTPEFGFEKDKVNVEEALRRFDIKYPVVLDNDQEIWNLYSNHWWPRKLIIFNGKIVYDHIGEGNYDETEKEIRRIVGEEGKIKLPPFESNKEGEGGICMPATGEIYLGYVRGTFSHGQNLAHDKSSYYEILEEIQEDKWYLKGQWIAREEYLQHARRLKEYKDFIFLRYKAFSVNLVLKTREGKPTRVLVELDGKPLNEKNKGRDVIIGKDGTSYLITAEPRMYEIVKSEEFHEGRLKVYSLTDDFQVYAFTFGSCEHH